MSRLLLTATALAVICAGSALQASGEDTAPSDSQQQQQQQYTNKRNANTNTNGPANSNYNRFDPSHAPHQGIIPNHITNPNNFNLGGGGGVSANTNPYGSANANTHRAATGKLAIDLNNCVNERRKASLDVESAQSSLRAAEAEAKILRDDEERCRSGLHSLASEVELLRQENQGLKLRLKHSEGVDERCTTLLADQQKASDRRVRAVEDAADTHATQQRLAEGGAVGPGGTATITSGAALSYNARIRGHWENTVQQLELKLLSADRDMRTLHAQQRSLEATVRGLSGALEAERLASGRSRSKSKSLSPSISLEDAEKDGGDGDVEDTESIKLRLRNTAAAMGVGANQGLADDDIAAYDVRNAAKAFAATGIRYTDRKSDTEHDADRKREHDLLWKVRKQAANHQRQHEEAQDRLERLRRTVEHGAADPEEAAEAEEGGHGSPQ